MIENTQQTDIKREKTLKAIETLCLFDDDLMNLVFDRNIPATELLLRIILKRDDLKVIEVVAQREYKNPMAGGRSITIDIYAEDAGQKVYDIPHENGCGGDGAADLPCGAQIRGDWCGVRGRLPYHLCQWKL